MQPKQNSWLVRKIGYGATSAILAAVGLLTVVLAGDWEGLAPGIVMLIGAVSQAVATAYTNKDSDVSANDVVERVANEAATLALDKILPPSPAKETGMAGYYANQSEL